MYIWSKITTSSCSPIIIKIHLAAHVASSFFCTNVSLELVCRTPSSKPGNVYILFAAGKYHFPPFYLAKRELAMYVYVPQYHHIVKMKFERRNKKGHGQGSRIKDKTCGKWSLFSAIKFMRNRLRPTRRNQARSSAHCSASARHWQVVPTSS